MGFYFNQKSTFSMTWHHLRKIIYGCFLRGEMKRYSPVQPTRFALKCNTKQFLFRYFLMKIFKGLFFMKFMNERKIAIEPFSFISIRVSRGN